jgi:parvulin-like peptidyl-prolyl isomerase
MRSHALTALAAALLVAVALGCGRDDSGEVIARVNQRPITQHQLGEYLESAEDGWAGRRALDALIVNQLIRQEAEKKGVKVSRAEIEARVEGKKDYLLASSGKDWEAWLEDTGQTEKDVMNQVSLQILRAKLVLTPEDRKEYFEEHKEELKDWPPNNESVIYRQIIVASKEEADAIYAELTGESGADFAAIADERSLDPMTKGRGGMAGWVIREKADDPEMEEVLFTLEPGQVSQPLLVKIPSPETGDEGEAPPAPAPEFWRIVKVEKRLSAREITLEANAEIIEANMLSEPQFQMQLAQFYSNLRARADIEILSDRYKAVADLYRQERQAWERPPSVPTGALPVLPVMPESVSPPPGAEDTVSGASTE